VHGRSWEKEAPAIAPKLNFRQSLLADLFNIADKEERPTIGDFCE